MADANPGNEPGSDADVDSENDHGSEAGPGFEASTADRPAAGDRSASFLRRCRTDPTTHAGALALAYGLGVGLAWVHWLGLVLTGAVVGLVSPTLRRAVLAAFGFGAFVLVVFASTLGGATWHVLEMAPISYLTAASALGLPILGSLVRGVV